MRLASYSILNLQYYQWFKCPCIQFGTTSSSSFRCQLPRYFNLSRLLYSNQRYEYGAHKEVE
ncbi:hypothetical protein C0J52_14682 [Blattella germanica]|nr:hypothetical protein C0J52_14682 [Blattella germanica]